MIWVILGMSLSIVTNSPVICVDFLIIINFFLATCNKISSVIIYCDKTLVKLKFYQLSAIIIKLSLVTQIIVTTFHCRDSTHMMFLTMGFAEKLNP